MIRQASVQRRAMAFACLLCLANRPAIYPPEIAEKVWTDVAEFEEPTFYGPNALAGFKSRYRLAISGIVCTSYVIRIDELPSRRILGIVKSRNRCQRNEPNEQLRRFTVNRIAIDDLLAAFKRAQMWEIYPEFWGSKDPQEICLDGEELIFEKLTERGVGFSTANAQCTAPPGVLDAARSMILLSGEKDALRLLR